MAAEELMIMWNELGLSGGTAIIILIALYFVIKWAVKNGIKEAYTCKKHFLIYLFLLFGQEASFALNSSVNWNLSSNSNP